jgi:hypothetical protein
MFSPVSDGGTLCNTCVGAVLVLVQAETPTLA